MAFNGLNPARAFFFVTYRSGMLLKFDLLTAALQVARGSLHHEWTDGTRGPAERAAAGWLDL
jgi:hypothetical protein